jgi:hypothetical protein
MKNIGMTSIWVSAMNDCIWLIRAAAITPKAVMAKASRTCSAKTCTSITGA